VSHEPRAHSSQLSAKASFMIKNYFKVAYRNLLRNKSFSIINISGLAIGMASAILILLWIQNEVSYDRFHANGQRLYEIYSNDSINNSIRSLVNTPEVMQPVLKTDVPGIDEASRFSWDESLLSIAGEKNLKAAGAIVDTPFLKMFSFPLLKGDARSALKDPSSIVLTQKLAKKNVWN
jgi:putative ABC transport system permease protein